MALAGTMSWSSGASWNPFRIHETKLPPELLLMAKVIVVGLFVRQYHLGFPDVFVPFFEWMEIFPEPWYRRAFKVAFIVSGTALLFNRAVRVNCLIIGGLFLIATLSSKVYYRNAKVFVGALFFLIGLQERGRPPWMIWWQLAIMYFGAGLNKLLEPDWRSGQYFDYFLTNIYASDAFRLMRPLLPGRWVARLMCWSIIVLELAAGVLFTMKRFRPTAVWLAAAVHVGAALLVAGDYGIYAAALLASYLSCMPWPERLDAALDPNGRWAWVRRFFGPLDQDRKISWHGEDRTGDHLVLRAGDRVWLDWKAAGWLAMWTPALYFVVFVVLTMFRGGPERVFAVRFAATIGAVVLVWTAVLKLRELLSSAPKPTRGMTAS